MDYLNGREPKAGDLVRGWGYNIKHEIVGKLVAFSAKAESCNCLVETITCDDPFYVGAAALLARPDHGCYMVTPSHEYGQLDRFVAISPGTGEELPPQWAEAPPETLAGPLLRWPGRSR